MRPIHIATAATAFVAGMAGISYLDRQPSTVDEQGSLSNSLSSLSENIKEPIFKQPVNNMKDTIHSSSERAWEAMLDLPDIFASKEQKEAIKRVKDIPANNFFELASWARETNNLQGFQRSMAFNAGRALTNGEISARLAEPAVKIYDLAVSRGFRPSEQSQ